MSFNLKKKVRSWEDWLVHKGAFITHSFTVTMITYRCVDIFFNSLRTDVWVIDSQQVFKETL